jgi:hypothetical protein
MQGASFDWPDPSMPRITRKQHWVNGHRCSHVTSRKPLGHGFSLSYEKGLPCAYALGSPDERRVDEQIPPVK